MTSQQPMALGDAARESRSEHVAVEAESLVVHFGRQDQQPRDGPYRTPSQSSPR
ncbi:MAG TPA: hypothetical protein VGQ58_00365 [Candidatus Limnocylindrales bacterium]|nr:hypothetical protein [Candidatus Limnocylindrales bacterium]